MLYKKILFSNWLSMRLRGGLVPVIWKWNTLRPEEAAGGRKE
jgi:hypothetical protein